MIVVIRVDMAAINQKYMVNIMVPMKVGTIVIRKVVNKSIFLLLIDNNKFINYSILLIVIMFTLLTAMIVIIVFIINNYGYIIW